MAVSTFSWRFLSSHKNWLLSFIDLVACNVPHRIAVSVSWTCGKRSQMTKTNITSDPFKDIMIIMIGCDAFIVELGPCCCLEAEVAVVK